MFNGPMHIITHCVGAYDFFVQAEDEAVRRDLCVNGSQCVTAGLREGHRVLAIKNADYV